MTVQERLQAAHQQSVAVYLRRQTIEAERARWANEAQRADQELLVLDGELRVLTELVREAGLAELSGRTTITQMAPAIVYPHAAEAN